ncbi:PQQ-binding-like beta-propeller repeat protein [Halosimplex pelagicum]|uniref:PQQ-like beta-propeller repeat protein n=1 Tax=Halosimplex pelagicum TaxID=869886 RepID=A0A7D5THX6_9EURY|nr:PQQ-binding-like beta-propeller repeat protein [Halosimplex pelagicum]QLH83296.1 PQQ-like beta-propeller repeat protein [Halosimplex pelagicum]
MDATPGRRSVLRAAGAVGAAAFTGCPADLGGFGDSGPAETDWPSQRFGPRNTAVHPSASGPGGDLSVAWTADYLADPVGESDGVSIQGPPIVLDGTVVSSAYIFVDGEQMTVVSAFDLESGERQWERSFPFGDLEDYLEVPPSATIGSDGRRVLVETATDEPALTALSPADGETEWSRPLERPLASPVTAAGGSVVAGEQLFTVHDTEDGTRQSRYSYEGDEFEKLVWTSQYPPTVTEDTIYAPAYRELHAIDRESGERRWTATNDFYSIAKAKWSAPFNPPVVADGVAYATAGYIDSSDTGGMVALDTEDGSVLWTALPDGTRPEDFDGRDYRSEQTALYGVPILLGGTLYAHGYERGEWGLFAVDPDDGSVERLRATGADVGADGLLYGLTDGKGATVQAFDPASDRVAGTATVDGWDPARGGYHAVAGEYLVLTTTEGVAAFGPN